MNNSHSLFSNNTTEFDMEDWINKCKELDKEIPEELSTDTAVRTNKQIDMMFDNFMNSLHSKINKMKYIIYQEISGPSGASRRKEFDPVETNKTLIKICNKFEKDLELEIENFKTANKNIIDGLNIY